MQILFRVWKLAITLLYRWACRKWQEHHSRHCCGIRPYFECNRLIRSFPNSWISCVLKHHIRGLSFRWLAGGDTGQTWVQKFNVKLPLRKQSAHAYGRWRVAHSPTIHIGPTKATTFSASNYQVGSYCKRWISNNVGLWGTFLEPSKGVYSRARPQRLPWCGIIDWLYLKHSDSSCCRYLHIDGPATITFYQ